MTILREGGDGSPHDVEQAPTPNAAEGGDRTEAVLDGSARWVLVNGEALAVLARLPHGSVDAIITERLSKVA